jgi:hypothetical protein
MPRVRLNRSLRVCYCGTCRSQMILKAGGDLICPQCERRELVRPRQCKRAFLTAIAVFFVVIALNHHASAASPARDGMQHATSWLGNSFYGSIATFDPPNSGKWVQKSVDAMCVTPDGRVIATTWYEEMAKGTGLYDTDGNVLGMLSMGNSGWPGGYSNTVNSKYVFTAFGNSDQGLNGFRRYTQNPVANPDRNLFGITYQVAPFTGGQAPDNSLYLWSHVPIPGMAANDANFFVSDPESNQVRVYDANSMTLLRTFPFNSPGKIAVDTAGNLWIVQTTTNTIFHYSSAGSQLSGAITDAGVPTALAIDNQGRLMVGDSGPRQQVLFYNINSGGTPGIVATLGVAGGIYSGIRGEVGDLKLASPVGVGADANGNFYVASGIAGTDIRKFSPAGTMLWRRIGLVFVDAAVADPASDAQDVYTAKEHFVLDYSKSNGQEAAWKGMTIDSLRFPNDIRLKLHPSAPSSVFAVRNIQGHKYLFMTDQYSGYVLIYRMESEIAVPCGIISPASNGWLSSNMGGMAPTGTGYIWIDANGDGQFQASEFHAFGGEFNFVWGLDVDANGNFWWTSENAAEGLREFPLQGVDARGNLIYTLASSVPFGTPAPFSGVERVKYVAQTDTLYLSGYTGANPKTGSEWGSAGREIVRFDGWSAGNRAPRYRITLPYPDPNNYGAIHCIDVAGGCVVAGMLNCQGWATNSSPHDLYLYDSNTGAAIGEMLPGPEAGECTSWLDGSHMLHMSQRANGEYVIFHEEDAFAKILMYRFGGDSTPPTISLTAPTQNQTLSGTIAVTASAADNVSVAGVQFTVDGANQGAEVLSAPYTINWDTTTAANGAHTLSAIARDGSGNTTASAPVSITVSNATSSTIRVNCGGGDYIDSSGVLWKADYGFSAGHAYGTAQAIAGTTDQPLYQQSRWNETAFQYQFAVPNGQYNVKLKFAENYLNQTGARVFNVNLNGAAVLANFDVVAATGAGFKATDKQFSTSVSNGQIVIQLAPVVSNPNINAIEITPTQESPYGGTPWPVPGTIQAEDFDNGGEGIAYHDTSAGNTGGGYRNTDVDVRACGDTGGGYQVGWTDNGEWLKYSVNVTAAGQYALTVRAASGGGGGTVHVEFDGVNVSGPINITNTGSFDTWQSFTVPVTVTAGLHTIKLVIDISNGFDLNYLQFAPANLPPVITSAATAMPSMALVNQTVTFAVGASDPENGTLTYMWNFGDGTPRSATPTHAFATAGNFAVTVTVTDPQGASTTSSVNVQVIAAQNIAINSGGAASGAFSSDTYVSGGQTFATTTPISTTGVTNPAPQAVYQSVRYGNFTYTLGGLTTGVTYTVRLHFAEIYWNSAGQRVFNVAINGQQVLANFDIFAAAGGKNIALVKQFTAAPVNGQITIAYTTVKDNAMCCGIEVLASSVQTSSRETDSGLSSIDLGTVKVNKAFKLKLDAPESGKQAKSLRWVPWNTIQLPNGILAATGLLRGKPKATGTFTFSLHVAGKGGDTTTTYSISIIP